MECLVEGVMISSNGEIFERYIYFLGKLIFI